MNYVHSIYRVNSYAQDS